MVRLTIDVAVRDPARLVAVSDARREAWGYDPDEPLTLDERVQMVLLNNADREFEELGCEPCMSTAAPSPEGWEHDHPNL